MELRTLRYFLAAAREENITRAAESLHISQPSLSRQLMELEQEVGKQLLIRGKRKITLTEDGVLLRKRADEIVTLMEKAERELRADTMQVSGEIAIGGCPTASVLKHAAAVRREYAVLRAYSGTEALLLLKSSRPSLILLDLMLPGLSGEAVLPQIQGIPVIVVSAKVTVQDKVDLLLSGAADYLTKPFDTKELLARVAVRLREASRSPLAAVYTCGSLTLDTASHEVCTNGTPVQLTRTEYAILKLLMQNPGQVLAKSVLLDRISTDTPDCTENSLKTHISNLRGKLRSASGHDYVEAVWGIGFQLKTES